MKKGESNIVIVDSKGNKVSQVIPAGLSLMVKQGDTVKTDQALNMDPNAGGFGQEESKYKTLYESLVILLLFLFLLTQISLVLKKRKFKLQN
jgi:hypothetical protein